MGTANLVQVKSEVFGARRGEEGLPTVSVDLPGLEAALEERVTVSELIGRVVEQQIRELDDERRRYFRLNDRGRELLVEETRKIEETLGRARDKGLLPEPAPKDAPNPCKILADPRRPARKPGSRAENAASYV